MTRDEAIDLLDNLIGMIEDNHESDYDTALRMGIKSLEYDDAKYHEEHGEVIVDKAVWEDAKRALEQKPCGDAVSRQAVIDVVNNPLNIRLDEIIKQLPSFNPQPTGHCEDCKHFRKLPYHADTLGKCFHHGGFCPKGDWYCADFEPQEGE